jgi:hypothetical protein
MILLTSTLSQGIIIAIEGFLGMELLTFGIGQMRSQVVSFSVLTGLFWRASSHAVPCK